MIPRYRVDLSETAELEADEIFIWMNRHSPSRAIKWYRGFLDACNSLSEFPFRFEALPNRADLRRLLYGKYRIIYSVVEPHLEEEEATVRILHIYHGARNR
jgi:plasmid stabilization system protein ParE